MVEKKLSKKKNLGDTSCHIYRPIGYRTEFKNLSPPEMGHVSDTQLWISLKKGRL